MSDQEKTRKRDGGSLDAEGNWYVLTQESTKTDKGWVHKCGEFIINSEVALSHRMRGIPLAGSGEVQHLSTPYCPKCENKPVSGTFGPGVQGEKGYHISVWERST